MHDPSRWQRRKVYDPVLRLIHAWNALAIAGLLSSAMLAEAFEHGRLEDAVWGAHVVFGHAIAGGLVARIVWGLIGPRHARWSALWFPAEWRDAWAHRRLPRATGFGHDPAASLAFIALYVVLGVMTATGFALAAIELGQGPLAGWLARDSRLEDLFEAPHEALAWAVGGFVVLHLGALLWHQRIRREPVARSMLDGWQRRPADHRDAGTP